MSPPQLKPQYAQIGDEMAAAVQKVLRLLAPTSAARL